MGEPEEVVTEFLLSYYMQAETAPAEVFLERELPDRPLLKFHRTAGTVPARSLSARTPNRAAGQALLDSIADFCLPRNLFCQFSCIPVQSAL